MNRKNVIYFGLFVATSVFTLRIVWGTDKELDFQKFAGEIAVLNYGWIGAAAACGLAFVICEGLALRTIIEGTCVLKRKVTGMSYSAADVFFSAITPSSSGGQPASALLMIRDGLSGVEAGLTLLIDLVIYNVFVLTFGIIACVVGCHAFMQMSLMAKVISASGYFAVLFLTIFTVLIIVKEKATYKIFSSVISWLHKIKLIKKPLSKRKQLVQMMYRFRQGVKLFFKNPQVIWRAVFYNLLQRLMVSMTGVCCFMSLGNDRVNPLDIWSIQMIATVGSYGIPIPGGIGIYDYVLLNGYKALDAIENIQLLETLTRGISFYLCVVFSIIILAADFFIKYREKE